MRSIHFGIHQAALPIKVIIAGMRTRRTKKASNNTPTARPNGSGGVGHAKRVDRSGVWLGVGLLFVAAAFRLHPLRNAVLAAIGMIFVGGLARFSGSDLGPLMGADLLPSLLAELLLFPLLALWIVKAKARPAA